MHLLRVRREFRVVRSVGASPAREVQCLSLDKASVTRRCGFSRPDAGFVVYCFAMSGDDRSWVGARLDPLAHEALASGLPASEVWSLLMGVLEERARARTPASLREQWRRDRFVQPCAVDQRTLLEMDAHLFAAAAEFEAIELSPLAPLGACASMALASQNKIVSTARGTEVVSDPTNVLALECAGRLGEGVGGVDGGAAGRRARGMGSAADAMGGASAASRAASDAAAADASPVDAAAGGAAPLTVHAPVRLATSHRCTRAQAVPKRPGFAAHFRMFCLASAGHERANRELTSSALTEHINTHLRALERLKQHGYAVSACGVRLLSIERNAELARQVAAGVQGASVEHQVLDHGYYDGIRFMIDVLAPDGSMLPLIDGGAFDWLRKLTSNNKLVYVASGMGSQILAMLFRR